MTEKFGMEGDTALVDAAKKLSEAAMIIVAEGWLVWALTSADSSNKIFLRSQRIDIKEYLMPIGGNAKMHPARIKKFDNCLKLK
jgi:hypothetical protein